MEMQKNLRLVAFNNNIFTIQYLLGLWSVIIIEAVSRKKTSHSQSGTTWSSVKGYLDKGKA